IKLAALLMMDKSQKRHITLIDKNPRDVEEANRVFAKLGLNINVILGKGTDVNLLKDNRIEKTDAFVAVTAKEQTNIISSLLAKQLGATRTIVIIEHEDIHTLIETLPAVDTVVNTKLSAVSTIFPYILSRTIESMSIIEGDARVVEMRIPRKSKFSGRPIKKLPLPSGVKIGALIRGKETYIPKKEFEIKSGDRLILFGKGNFVTRLSGLF
ncbi:MAG: NAD-binding protein, partial [Thermoplasmata archaeon]|nr:NAD-binding protein [Thermoplasmata archaeon]